MKTSDGKLALSILRQLVGEWGISHLQGTQWILDGVVQLTLEEDDLLRRLNGDLTF